MKTWNTATIRAAKGKQPFACITAYDTPSARIFDEAGVAFILVGDSVGNNVLGFDSTVPVTMDMMAHHVKAVVRGARNAMVVADMPFLSYQISRDEAMRNAGRLIQECGADAVKLEGGEFRADLVRDLTSNGIPVCAHIGLTPQSVLELGGFKMQGKLPEQAEQLVRDAKALSDAGAFAIVLECIPDALAEKITASIPIPTIGIGAGPKCDGQILVMHDLLGINAPEHTPKFVKRYAEVGSTMMSAVQAYVADVASNTFPPPRIPKPR